MDGISLDELERRHAELTRERAMIDSSYSAALGEIERLIKLLTERKAAVPEKETTP
jgi:hypothetical protein